MEWSGVERSDGDGDGGSAGDAARIVALASAVGRGEPAERQRLGARAVLRRVVSSCSRLPRPVYFRGQCVRFGLVLV